MEHPETTPDANHPKPSGIAILVELVVVGISICVLRAFYPWSVIWDAAKQTWEGYEMIALLAESAIVAFCIWLFRKLKPTKPYFNLPCFSNEKVILITAIVMVFLFNLFVIIPHRIWEQSQIEIGELKTELSLKSDYIDNIFPDRYAFSDWGQCAVDDFEKGKWKNSATFFEMDYSNEPVTVKYDQEARTWPFYAAAKLNAVYYGDTTSKAKTQALNDFSAYLDKMKAKVEQAVTRKDGQSGFSSYTKLNISVYNLKKIERVVPAEVTNDVEEAIKFINAQQTNVIYDF